jgi:hypothetical protein
MCQDLIEAHLHECFTTSAYHIKTKFDDSFPATEQEVVPQLEQPLINYTVCIGVLVQLVCEEGYEPCCSEEV